ncbi:MAG TPA: transporter substrate-binding domain-containing protein [Gordonia sp. (in: high G+C Gram-positive bacteria)]|uniref:transporter substrate-binding domain-containing protein n=1 Tax=unclassified Gordonia (in: high G+C Gram-positive bacteria) TaxID=2657482 RepID=UPI0025C3B444|nr:MULTISPECIES: transporter substrate-binding domain-containing protein [unclassified Gordonia (in: high G+C Gram-positive bacteria)]HNP57866.1 transporter substrate-binding domain-containing protein [Gordonia sp. (in: high G+C Gram-positive bacteria)]HRC51418.1 transporter substrate-binding domain-containing protein [Gordonia sp. (in: high G+C Gram-positive bacteria)]
MHPRLRALSLVLFLLGMMVGAPAGQPVAHAEPRNITVITHPLAPFVMVEGSHRTGFTVDLWDEIAQRSGWTTTYRDVDSVKDQLAGVTSGAADVGAGAISITSERTARYDFSQPILNAGMQIMVPAGKQGPTTPGLRGFLDLLLSKTMLVWLASALVLALVPAHFYWFVERRHPESKISRSYFPGIVQALGAMLGSLIAAGDDAPQHWLTRGLFLLWAFVGVIFVAFYTANLTANLTVERFDSKISGPGDLVGNKVATVAHTTSAAFLKERGIKATEMDSVDGALRAIREGYDAVVFDAPVLQYYVAHAGKGIAQMSGPIFAAEDYGFAFKEGSDLRRQVDAALLSMREDGTYERIRQLWFGAEGSGGSEGGN